MTELPRYAPPKSLVQSYDVESDLPHALKMVLTGRRLLVVSLFILATSLLVQFAAQYTASLLNDTPRISLLIFGLFSFLVAAPVIAIVGAFRVGLAVGHSHLFSFVLACLVVPPALNVAVIGWLVVRSNKTLAVGGYKVGVFSLRNA